jgi:4-amino-4-deoxy-L-arabinose transferase-like glycosyltransferase
MNSANTSRKKIWLLGGAVFVLAAALRFFRLGMEGVWLDEGYTAWMSRQPITEMLSVLLRTDDAPPLYYIAQHYLIAFFGESEFVLRLLSTLTSLGVVAFLIRIFMGQQNRNAFWSALFFTVATYGVFYARQARSYSLVLILCFLVIYCARNLLMGRSKNAGPWLALWGSLLLMTHNIGGIFLVCGLPLWWLNWRRNYKGASLASWLLWHGIPFLVWAIWLSFSYNQLESHQTVNQWMGEFWKSHSLLFGPLIAIGTFVPGLHKPEFDAVNFPVFSAGIDIFYLLSLGAVIVIFAWVLQPFWPGKRGAMATAAAGAWRSLVVDGAYFLLPLLALTAISLVWAPVLVIGRTEVIALPAFALLMGRGLARLPRPVSVAIILFWLTLTVCTLAPSYGLDNSRRIKGADRQTARTLVEAGLAPHDWLIHSSLTQPSMNYYLKQFGAPHNESWFPAETGVSPANLAEIELSQMESYLIEAAAKREEIGSQLPAMGTVWIIAVIDERYAGPPEGWTRRGSLIDANQLAFPTSLLLYSFVGLNPVESILAFKQDWVNGNRVLLKVKKSDWVPIEDLPPVRAEEK